ncbi:DNA replication complex GINS protein PSF2-like isoform X2 [Artemia franciscana]|uniref:DNA replication complex GINS protein PSF2 n=2 Tax=Artemia franciscana TaxID=6661 RepID=A0AA88KRR0_ARTSF|nr:hypothetical protein QYM36_018133 [Artemia franciscana]KAK2703408.1 hypothetical protein QYM36_018133 [Artemia franciscana]
MATVLDPCDLAFLAEHTQVKVLPKVPGPVVQLAEGVFGPFRPGIPAEVPLWVAVNLRQRNKCKLLPPDWMSVEQLRTIKEEEIAATGFTKMPSENYFEVTHILLTNGLSDFDDADEMRGLVKSIWDLRLSKLRASVLQFVADGGFHAKLDNLTQTEINSIRPVFPQALTQLMRIKEGAANDSEYMTQQAQESSSSSIS